MVFTGASEGQYDSLSVFTDPTISLVMEEYTLALPACSDNPLGLAKEVTPNPCLFPGEEDATVHYAIAFSFDGDEFDFEGSDTCSDAVVISDYLPDGLIPAERSISNGGTYYPDEHLVQWTVYASTGSVSFDAYILPSFTGEVAVNVAAAWIESVCTEDESPLSYPDDGQLLSLTYINTDICTEMPALDTLTVTSREGGSVTTPGEGTFGPYYHGETIDLVATPDTDYSFVNWTGTGASAIDDPNSASTFITMNGDYEIQANFVPIQWLRVNGVLNNCCSITIDTDDNTPNELSNGDSGVFAFPEGTAVTLSATTCADCCGEESQFSYWLVFTGASEGQYDSLSVFTDPTISLVMEENTLALPACSDNTLGLAKEVTPNPCLFPGEEDATVHYAIAFSFDGDEFDFEGSDTCSDAVVISDYLPDGLIPAERSISNGGTYYPDEHLVQWTVYASTGSVSFDAYILPSFTGEVAVNVASAWVENVCTEDESPLGYHDDGQLLSFAYVNTDDICTERPATNTVTFVAGSGGTLTGDVTQQLPDGGDCATVTAKANTGYQFAGWIISSGDKNGSFSQLHRTALTITNVTGDTHVTANFRPIGGGVSFVGPNGEDDDGYSVEFQSPSETTNYTLLIEVNPADSGSTDPSLGSYSYEEGTVINISATPWDGYEFLNWIGDTSGTLSAITVTMDGNKSVTANFQVIPLPMIRYILTMISAEGGDTDPAAGDHSFEEGSLVTITAIPTEGYIFEGWTGDVENPGMATTTVTMDEDKEITAKFSEIGSPVIFHTLTIEINGDEGCETNPESGSYQYEAGTVVVITANAADGWEFLEWTGTDELAIDESNLSTATITMDGDYTITANFEENSSPTNWPMISGLIAALLAILIALILFILNKRKETA